MSNANNTLPPKVEPSARLPGNGGGGMSLNPFKADPAVRLRLAAQDGAAVRADLRIGPGQVVPVAEVARVVAAHGLSGTYDLMLHLLPAASAKARPPISDFHVGAVGLTAAGDLILGCNLEWPGSHLGMTVHGEGFVMTRALYLGATITALALGEAHPCAHCRQYISEFAPSRDMVLIDLLGHRLTMADLYPWPFDPGYLGQTGAVPGAINWPGLRFDGTGPAPLLDAGRRAWAPYSACPGALLVELADGARFTGLSVESVAFNPTIQPVQAALIEVIAAGREPGEIVAAHLGTVAGGAVDYTRATAEVLAAVAPSASLTVHPWTA